ncbi:MAG TPA: DUF4233 domain-containing protein [Trebonia sp.]
MKRLCGTVLIMEAVVVLLAIVPSIQLEHVSGSTAGAVGGAIAVVAIILSGLVGRPRMGWALYAGSVLQILVIASGVLVPAMYILGVIFALLWFTGIWLARKVEREQHAREAAAVAAAANAANTTDAAGQTAAGKTARK